MKENELIELAGSINKNAYAPYSNTRVSAAILGKDGNVYTGVNVENASYGLTICAERSAVCNAVASGCREFDLIVVYSNASPPTMPCGACRQVLVEFSKNLSIICANDKNELKRYQLDELLPMPFRSSKR
jgi:cytidine deaminase